MIQKTEKGKLTGKHVLAISLSFFGVIFAMNFYMAYMAFGTFTGLDENNAYHKGRLFNQELNAANQQLQDKWQVDLHYQLQGNDKILVQVKTKDQTGMPLKDLSVRVKLRRPTQAHMDQKIVLTGNGTGFYQGVVPLPQKGQWDLIVLAFKNDQKRYKSVKRIILK